MKPRPIVPRLKMKLMESHGIMTYMLCQSQQYLEHASENDKRILKRLVVGFFFYGEILYKKGRDQVLLRYVDTSEARRIIIEIREGCAGCMLTGIKCRDRL